MSRFSQLQQSIQQKEGYSAARAAAIAASAGRKKYGKAGMAKLAAEGRRRIKNKSKKGTLTDSRGDTYKKGAKYDSAGDRLMGKKDSRGDRLR